MIAPERKYRILSIDWGRPKIGKSKTNTPRPITIFKLFMNT